MTTKTSLKTNDAFSLKNVKFPELPLFIIISLIFLNVGILLGSLNALYWGNETTGISWIDNLVTSKIHQTHWTSTLLGGVSILMLGQIYFFFSQISEKKNPLHLGTIVVLILWLTGLLYSYLLVWKDVDRYVDILNLDLKVINLSEFDLIVDPIKIACGLFLILILIFFISDPNFIAKARNHPALFYFISACIWLSVAIFWRLDLESGALDRVFLTLYIYGFFSLTLFGSLTFVLPILTEQKPKSNSSVYFTLFLLNAAAVVIGYGDYLLEEEDKKYFFLDFIGPFLWGLAAFLFILYVFDLIYKSGVSPYLLALLVALFMFSFFVVDTLMKNLFEQWVSKRHFHFMFIGTLVMTIVAIGSRLIVMQYDPVSQKLKSTVDKEFSRDRSNVISITGIAMTVLGVSGVLTGFTLEYTLMAAVSGLILFFGLVTTEIVMLNKMRLKMKSVE